MLVTVRLSAAVLELCCFEWFQNRKNRKRRGKQVLELCCFEWFQNYGVSDKLIVISFRAVLFRMVPKLFDDAELADEGFRAVLFRMVPKLWDDIA